MACDFNGNTSKDENTSATHAVGNLMTMLAWAYADGLGGNDIGFIMCLDESVNSARLGHDVVANNLRFEVKFSGGLDGKWTFPAQDGVWNAVALSYDGANTTTNPVARVNFASATITEDQNPTGITFVQPLAGYCIGNSSGQTRGWDGMLMHVQLFNVILTARETDQALHRPGSIRRGLQLWRPLRKAGSTSDLSKNLFNGTQTAVTDRVGGPPCAPLYNSESYSPYTAIAAGGRISKLVGFGGGLVGSRLGRVA